MNNDYNSLQWFLICFKTGFWYPVNSKFNLHTFIPHCSAVLDLSGSIFFFLFFTLTELKQKLHPV